MAEGLIALVSAFVGALLTFFFERIRDRSKPECSIVRLSFSTIISEAQRNLKLRFPSKLATQFNENRDLPAIIDPAKEIPIKDYLESVDEMLRTTAITLSKLKHFRKEVESELFRCLDKGDHLGFAMTFSEYNGFLWSHIHGRCRRHEEPPSPPEAVIDLSTINSHPKLHVFQDKEGNYMLDVAGSVHKITLQWSDETAPVKRDRAQKVASLIVRDIAEFRLDSLRVILGAISNEVDNSISEITSIQKEIEMEKSRLSFLSVTALARNKGTRPYCLDKEARLFINTRKYSYQSDQGGEIQTQDSDTVLELMCAQKDEAASVLEIAPGTSQMIDFTTKEVLIASPNSGLLQILATAGERLCYLGFIPYTEKSTDGPMYTDAVMFSVRHPHSSIQPTKPPKKWQS